MKAGLYLGLFKDLPKRNATYEGGENSVSDKKRNIIVAITFVAFFALCVLHGVVFRPQRVKTQAAEEDWFAAYQQGDRKSRYSRCDATNDLIFFAYDHSFVDAYDPKGEFQFTLYFENKQNGGFHIRCEEQKLYVSTKGNSVFIFERDQEVCRMNLEEARENGFSYLWFDEEKPNFRIDNGYAYLIDSQSNEETVFHLSQTIKNQVANRKIGTVIMLCAVIVLICRIAYDSNRKAKNTAPRTLRDM